MEFGVKSSFVGNYFDFVIGLITEANLYFSKITLTYMDFDQGTACSFESSSLTDTH